MEQLTSRTLAPIYDLDKVPPSVPRTWIDAARLGGPEGVRAFLDNPDNAALRETLPLMTSYIHEHAVDLFIAEFTRPDLENAKPEPVLTYAFTTHDEKEPYLTARLGPLPQNEGFPAGYPEDLKQLATVHAGFFDHWTFGGPAPVDVFKPLGIGHRDTIERRISNSNTDPFPFVFEDENFKELPDLDRPEIKNLCPVWSLGDRKRVRFLCVDNATQVVWFVTVSEGIGRISGTASEFIDDAVSSGFSAHV
ncbi:Knr4/Smi1-like domain-containing protein OS=Tsukamurella paurometabola (strain ATCC 8368 / DSM/ CCUG 35730 / CIP 100753 / JCM 10117 / KCTC 9821 / NBRC 16120 / NCIMB 702349 / NCTC 13040) OX=521096 GN=Tpau_4199 PE=4 SV=1 [Tsukamurella paurometabola]|uniref:Uncharacterized protein n=1 Tax=Tsukamurella paurometabola (strain ATCC 8368 / DSM 20162 / CCUG 35730 / CIP 100753 / JCM 10117 / KCTC 9821 / NBRC 16120 / NCIMB 702349 / NCTC 13040) TaxID=521096 RepID=D5UP59_TSUPD|nr:hypothetical protein [Tsukamurella paurometabola]ADG80768.1 hypothetical protein Tpau_4199 [Tsukamurella paurometabola DSM 20162]SUP40905.1 Uncharacterised protein [Tsukamurella paurometabola]